MCEISCAKFRVAQTGHFIGLHKPDTLLDSARTLWLLPLRTLRRETLSVCSRWGVNARGSNSSLETSAMLGCGWGAMRARVALAQPRITANDKENYTTQTVLLQSLGLASAYPAMPRPAPPRHVASRCAAPRRTSTSSQNVCNALLAPPLLLLRLAQRVRVGELYRHELPAHWRIQPPHGVQLQPTFQKIFRKARRCRFPPVCELRPAVGGEVSARAILGRRGCIGEDHVLAVGTIRQREARTATQHRQTSRHPQDADDESVALQDCRERHGRGWCYCCCCCWC
jgi:hypothetical protein